MHANNQPQTTSNSNVQDAAIQIIEEAWEQMGVVARIASQVAGLLAERWHFFAEANHPQNLYYQAIA